ncbi:MAG: protein-methionine-sulfoxide reductase heme-binding subunit MsrQ [Polyangiales bacterium]
MTRANPDAWLKPGLLVGGLVPLVVLIVSALRGTLGANPIAEVLNQLGLLALIFLAASLAATPVKRLFGVVELARVRRMLGLFAFFYASLHLLTYALLDRFGELGTLLQDLAKRPFISVGFLAWLLLLPLAITSTRGMMKRLGFARWQRLHRLSYLAALLAVVHFIWRVKKDASEPLAYGAVILVLLATRVYTWLHRPARPS